MYLVRLFVIFWGFVCSFLGAHLLGDSVFTISWGDEGPAPATGLRSFPEFLAGPQDTSPHTTDFSIEATARQKIRT